MSGHNITPSDKTIGPFTYGFVNLGRNKGKEEVKKAMLMIRLELINSGNPWMMNFVEMDEGDKGYSDHDLIKIVFPKAYKIGMEFKNIIVIGGGARVLRGVVEKGSKGVKHWSPARNVIGTRVLLEEGTASTTVDDFCVHLPAGAYNGERPILAKKLLVFAYGVVRKVFEGVIDKGREGGHCQVYGIDANAKKWKPFGPSDVLVLASPPDFMRAVCPRGMSVVVHKTWQKPTGIEAHHDAMFATISFVAR